MESSGDFKSNVAVVQTYAITYLLPYSLLVGWGLVNATGKPNLGVGYYSPMSPAHYICGMYVSSLMHIRDIVTQT